MKGAPVRFASAEIYVYAYVSPSDVIVYIGRTYDPGTRHGAHRQRSAWWTRDLTFALINIAAGWEEAKRLEAQAIRTYQPVANIMHNSRFGLTPQMARDALTRLGRSA